MSIFPPENRTVCEIKWKNTVERVRPHMIIWLTRNACSIPKATNTLSKYIILTVLPLQQRLHDRALILRYTYIAACLVFFYALESQEDTSISSDQHSMFISDIYRASCLLLSFNLPYLITVWAG